MEVSYNRSLRLFAFTTQDIRCSCSVYVGDIWSTVQENRKGWNTYSNAPCCPGALGTISCGEDAIAAFMLSSQDRASHWGADLPRTVAKPRNKLPRYGG